MTHFIIERKVVGKKSWIKVGEVESKHTTFATDKVEEGKAYQFRILAVNSEGASEPLETEEIFAGDPIGKHLSTVGEIRLPCELYLPFSQNFDGEYNERQHLELTSQTPAA